MDDDWRLTGQERYFVGAVLQRVKYEPADPGNDHDHCEFCGAKFMRHGAFGTLDVGYTTADRYRWVCDTCFEDFADRFQFRVQAPS